MPAPIYDDQDEPPVRKPDEEPSFTVWAIMGGVLILLYTMVFVILRSV